MKKRQPGKALGIASHDFLLPKGIDPLIAVREAIQNSRDAGAQNIIILPHGEGTRIIDDGRGMSSTDMQNYFSDFGSGSSRKGREVQHRMGFGAKESAALVGIYQITSWKKGSTNASQVTIQMNDDLRQVEVVQLEGGGTVKTVPIPKISREIQNRKSTSGTIVDMPELPYEPTAILGFINQRYLDLQNVNVQVGMKQNGHVTFKRTLGSLNSLKMLCEYTGTQEYQSVRLHWGIRYPQPAPNQAEILEYWPAPPYTIAAGGEAIKWWMPHKGALRKLATAGVYCAQENIIFILEAKGDFTFNIFRTEIEGWDESHGTSEIESDLPPGISDYLRAWYAQHVDDKLSTDVFDYLMREFEVTLNSTIDYDDDWTPPGGGTGNPGTGKGGRTGPKDDDTGRSRRRRTGGIPEITFVDSLIANEPISVSRKVIQINTSFPTMAQIFEECGPQRKNREEAKALIKFHLVTQIAAYQTLHGGEFPEEDFLASVVLNPIMARMNNFGRISLPTSKQLKKFKEEQEKKKG